MRQLAAGVEVEQLRGHHADRRARLVALALPCRRAEPVQPRGRSITIAHGAVGLELIDPIERDVEPVPALVLHHRDLERGAIRPHGDGL